MKVLDQQLDKKLVKTGMQHLFILSKQLILMVFSSLILI